MDKTLDSKGRWRSVTVGFRMSPEENSDLDTRVRLSGLTKQDYIIRRLLCRDIVVQGNPRVYKALRNQMANIYTELKRLESGSSVDGAFLSTLRLVAETLNGMREETHDEE